MRLPKKTGALTLAAGAATGFAIAARSGARSLSGKRAWMERHVAADLRSPALLVPLPLAGPVGLKAVRVLTGLVERVAPVHGERRRTDDGVEVLVYQPARGGGPTGALVWIHGGGLIMGVAAQADPFARRVRDEVGAVVVSVDYRLAPEHPFPTPLDDCMSALRWLQAHADELGVDPARIAVGGDSAGGGLAAAVCQRALDEGGPAVALQLLVYPMLDDRTTLRADHDPEALWFWSPDANRFGWSSYLGRPTTSDSPPPYAVPARRQDLRGLPPAWVGVGSLDLFHDEDLEYARRLQQAGVPCDVYLVEGMWHAADAVRAKAPSMRRFRQHALDALGRSIGSRVGDGTSSSAAPDDGRVTSAHPEPRV